MLVTIRRQLGPVRKRINDRLTEAAVVLDGEQIQNIKDVYSKLEANNKYHKQLTTQLSEIEPAQEGDGPIIEKDLEQCINLDLDVNEMLAKLQDRILRLEEKEDDKNLTLKTLEREKVVSEIENLKLEQELKKEKILKLKKEPVGTHEPKLPKIALPTFSGDILKWPNFWDTYSSMVHNCDQLTKISKFKYLLSCLEDEAKETVRGFTVTGAQYDEAVELLKQRYDDREFIIHAHYESLGNTRKPANNTQLVRQTINKLEMHLRSLEALGENVNTKHLVAMVKRKLPSEFNLKLEELRDTNKDWDITTLRKGIQKLLTARERCEESLKEMTKENTDDEVTEYTTEGLLSKDFKVKCAFCKANHWCDECQKFKTVDQRKSQLTGRCYICLNSSHLSNQCMSTKVCYYCKKKGSHHSSLCQSKFGTSNSLEDGHQVSNDIVEIGEEVAVDIDENVIMKTAKIIAKNPNPKLRQWKEGMVLLDSGAKRTYITVEKANSLGLKRGPTKSALVNTFASTNPSILETETTMLSIKCVNGSVKNIRAKICKDITGKFTKQKINLERYANVWKGLRIADDLPDKERTVKIDILLGNDYYEDIMTGEKIQLADGLYLVNSLFGWMFSGRVKSSGSHVEEETNLFVEEDLEIDRSFWNLETMGIKGEELNENDELKAVEKFNETIKKVNNRYEVSFPWKESKYELPSNYKMCEARLKSLLTNMKDDNLKEQYNDIIRKQVDDGTIEEADCSDEYLQGDEVVTHYLPHHCVISGEKPRVVYEGNAKTHVSKKCLNECLYRGPNLVKDLGGILLRFRLPKIGLSADIEKAYVQMQLNPKDRDVVRFLWVKDITKPVTAENIKTYRFCRVIWGVICAAFLLACTIMFHLSQFSSPVVANIKDNLYVDNLITGCDSIDQAQSYYREVKSLFSSASMNMRKWSSNSSDLLKVINPEDKCVDVKVKVLGLYWDTMEDTLTISKSKKSIDRENVTKRYVLQQVNSPFDILGLFSPVLLDGKLILQETWKRQIPWDDPIPDDLLRRWGNVASDIENLHTVIISRCITKKFKKSEENEIIVFTDASKLAYAATVYLKGTCDGITDVNLILSRTRLAPLKQNLTIPRLELMAILMGCRLSKFVANELNVNMANTKLYTDSTCSIEWIHSKKDLKRFVNERVKEIRSYELQISYVCSKMNPADVASRGTQLRKLKENELWWKGPEWLRESKNEKKFTYEVTKEAEVEIAKELKGSPIFEAGLTVQESHSSPPFGINAEKYSSHHKLIRVTAWCQRFINMLRKESYEHYLTAREIKEANKVWIKHVQGESFKDSIKSIESSKPDRLTTQLGLYIDEVGIIRSRGRFMEEQDHPMLLPKKNHFTRLLVIKAHRKLLHAGTSQTLAEVRMKYWVIQGRSLVRYLIRQCLTCIFWEGSPFKTPPFAPFPEFKLEANARPFTYTGLDYLGPLFVKTDDTLKKNWICLFTCIQVRSIHLEVIEDMSTESFLLCLRRFIARRGKPSMIISDNGSQIKLASKVIYRVWEKAVKAEETLSYISSEEITWKFINEYSPWQGGFYERLVGLVKRSLRKTLQKSKVYHKQLETIVCEIEAVINSRPLVYLPDDIESIRVLTPSQFLSLGNDHGIPDIEEEYYPRETSSVILLEKWRKGQERLQRFWKSWKLEYLESLRERTTVQMQPKKGEINDYPNVGEVVHVREDDAPRGQWKIAKITKLIKSEIDGIPRAAELKSSSGRILKRPLKLIYPLECKD